MFCCLLQSEEEEMPFEAKMRMRNIGRETPTASGPNSFGKGKMGFCDRRALIKKELEGGVTLAVATQK